NGFEPTQEFKYPPSLYYLSYGAFISFLLYYLLGFRLVNKMLDIKPVIWLSKRSLELYFNHTIPIYVLVFFGASLPFINSSFVTRFLFLLTMAIILIYIQDLCGRF